MRDWGSHLRLWPVALVGLVADLCSKTLAFENLTPDKPVILISNVLSLHRVVNPGAMLGIGQGWGLLFVVASILALVFVLYLFAHSSCKRRSLHVALGLVLAGALGNLYDRTVHVADAVWAPPSKGSFHLLGGNRVRYCGTLVREDGDTWFVGAYPDGAPPIQPVSKISEYYLKPTPVVRDFIKIDLKIGSVELWRWVFNIADSLLVVGVGMLLLNFWGEHRRAVRLAAAQAEGTSCADQDESAS